MSRRPAAEGLARSLEPYHDQTLHHGAVDPGDFVGVLPARRDPSFRFIGVRTRPLLIGTPSEA
jgi:hypothetical protein